MTVSTTTAKSQYTGNGVTTVFTGSFRILDQTHITVVLTSPAGVDTVQALTSNYSVAGVGGSSFTVTFVVAPPSGHTITIARNVPITQELDLVLNDEFPSTEMENALDKVVMVAQQVNESVSRSLRTASSDTVALQTIPPAAQRASKYLAFDASGNPVAASGTPGSVVVSAFMQTVLDDADAAAARTTLAVPIAATQTEANTGTNDIAFLTPLKLRDISPPLVTYVTGDQLLVLDASDSNRMKRVNIGGIADFIAGSPVAINPFAVNSRASGAHGLPGRPDFYRLILSCVFAEHGYTPGDTIVLSSGVHVASGETCVIQVDADSTDTRLTVSNNSPPRIVHKTNTPPGAAVAITPANWVLTLEPYRRIRTV